MTKLKEKWFLYEKGGERFYHNGKNKVLTGITTILSEVMPTSKYLLEWQRNNSPEVLAETARFGSLMHLLILSYLMGEKWWELIPKDYYREREARRSLISFRNFDSAYGIKPILLEVALQGKIAGVEYGCTIDCLTGATVQTPIVEKRKVVRIDTKDEVWLIDHKSNFYEKEKTFYEQHLFQLLAQKEAVFQQTGIKVDRIFNWMPTGWRDDNGANTYKLVEWQLVPEKVEWNTQSYTQAQVEQFHLYMKLAKSRGINVPSGTITEYHDFVKGDDTPSVSKKNFLEYVKDTRKNVR